MDELELNPMTFKSEELPEIVVDDDQVEEKADEFDFLFGADMGLNTQDIEELEWVHLRSTWAFL